MSSRAWTKSGITAKRLREALAYDRKTGLFTWKILRRGHWRGAVAGTIDRDGYRTIVVDGTRYRAARLAWLYVHGRWPPNLIDHKNTVRDADHIANLRTTNNTKNQHNAKRTRTNTTGYKGVTLNQRGKYQAQIRVNGKRFWLGSFTTARAAHAAYCKAAIKYHGNYARTK